MARNGYQFDGCYLENTYITPITAVSILTTAENHYIYAKWTPNTYTVVYNANGGTGSIANEVMTFGQDYTTKKAGDGISKEHYVLNGWSETSNGEVDYFVNSTYGVYQFASRYCVTNTNNATITFYAVWHGEEYSITYKDEGDALLTGNLAGGYPVTHTYGEATVLPNATKTGYELDGWYGNPACTGARITSLGATDYTSAITVYAKWVSATYDINYLDQGGVAFSGNHASGYPTTHTYNLATVLASATRAGYTFDGWFTNIDCTGSAVTSLGATDYTADITLYAKWTQNVGVIYEEVGDTAKVTGYSGPNTITSLTIDSTYNAKPVTAIVAEAFKDFANLATVVIPNSVTSIGSQAFSGCAITSLTIGDVLTTLSNDAFHSACASGVSIYLTTATAVAGIASPTDIAHGEISCVNFYVPTTLFATEGDLRTSWGQYFTDYLSNVDVVGDYYYIHS